LEIDNLETKLPGFPPKLISIPPPPRPTSQPVDETKNIVSIKPDHKSDLEAFAYILNSPAFTTTENNSDYTPLPQQIYTPKHPHLPTGETITPVRQKSRNAAMLIDTPPSPDRNTTASTSEDTSTQDMSYPTFPEHQTEDFMDEETSSPPDDEKIPDSQYEFCPEHSQPTRLEIRDTLGIAASISERRYHEIYHFITSHGSAAIDLDTLKRLATRPLTPPSTLHRAHNDSKAQEKTQK
jgi:hypothetical protein